MKKSLIFLSLLIAGCQTPEQLNQMHHAKCAQDYGLKRGTDLYVQCRQKLLYESSGQAFADRLRANQQPTFSQPVTSPLLNPTQCYSRPYGSGVVTQCN